MSKRKSTINRLTVFFYRLIAKALFVKVLCGNKSLGGGGLVDWWIGRLGIGFCGIAAM
jgi:hypothetical protein